MLTLPEKGCEQRCVEMKVRCYVWPPMFLVLELCTHVCSSINYKYPTPVTRASGKFTIAVMRELATPCVCARTHGKTFS